MKEVLISIKPEWCGLIASGEKTVEVRKTKPKIATPFKCYIYETKAIYKGSGGCLFKGRGKVIGEFVCNLIEEVYQCNSGWVKKYACISEIKFFDYLGIPRETHFGYDKKAYAWFISDLVIYEKPKELSEFSRHDNTYDNSFGGAFEDRAKNVPITRPPQSWCYVEYEEVTNEN